MIKVFESFAGIGTQRMALRNLGIEHEVVGISEIDKFALKSYIAIHGDTKNFGDITKIKTEELPNFDLFTYSFPCQDISVAGKQKGLDEESGTRSSLLWECERIIKDKRPKHLLMENVKNLVGKKHKKNFEKWLEVLESIGYENYWQVLNAKDYGIPQNRERIFCISILGEHESYEFPKPFELKLRLKDLLEDNVDEKYYLNELNLKMLLKEDTGNYPRKERFLHNINKNTGIANTIQARQRTSPTDNYVKIKNATKKGYVEAKNGDGIDLAFPTSKTRRGRVQNGMSQTLDTGDSKGVVLKPKEEFGRMGKQAIETFNQNECNYGDTINPFNKTLDSSGNCPTLTTRPEGFKTAILPITEKFRIRKLTPLECWRLMGISDEDFYKAEQENSNTQLYKQAGNAIVVDVLEGIFKQLFNTGKNNGGKE